MAGSMAVVLFHLDYANSLLFGCLASNMEKPQRVQNTAVLVLNTQHPLPAQQMSFVVAACSLPHQLQNSHFNLQGSGKACSHLLYLSHLLTPCIPACTFHSQDEAITCCSHNFHCYRQMRFQLSSTFSMELNGC